MGKLVTIVVGSRVAALTAEMVYNVAHRLAVVEPDASSLEQIIQKRSTVVLAENLVSLDTPLSSKGEFLKDVEVRALLVVLLHKLLLGPPGIRKFLPIFITEVLNSDLALEIPALDGDVGVIRALVGNIYRLKNIVESVEDGAVLGEEDKEGISKIEIPGIGQLRPYTALRKLKNVVRTSGAGEVGVTETELGAMENSCAASVGISTLAYHSVNPLIVIADAVVALSCEALQANTAAFELESYKQAFVRKWEADVAGDLNSLLFGSKLVRPRKGGLDTEYIDNVPAAHGALRDAVKLLGPRLRVEINRVETISKKRTSVPASLEDVDRPLSPGTFSSSSSLFTSTLLSILISLGPNISGSFGRTAKNVESIHELSPDLTATEWDGNIDEEIVLLRRRLQSAAAIAAGGGNDRDILLSREALSAVEVWGRMLAKESAAALALLSIRERLSAGTLAREVGQDIAREQDSGNMAAANGKAKGAAGKPAKIKKDFVLGKGTDIVRQSLAGFLNARRNEDRTKFQLLSFVGKELDELLSPHSPELGALITEIKSVLESNETRRLPKIAKGTRDFRPEQMVIRERAFGIIVAVFKRHGAVALDTPVFELRETLMGKYGEDSKLIYDLADQGGEILSLRYDLTVPFARYLAMNKVENLKRYHIARVYRRDNPANGRYREFYQCDLDIAGHYALMVPDFEVLKVLTELLDELDIGDYEVKLNHRKLLDGMLDICGVPQAKFRSICSAIDKLDKLSWEQVRKEMIEEKGLTPEMADKIGGLVQKRGSPLVLLEELKQFDSPFLQHSGSTAALEELGVLFKYLKASKCVERIVFDLSLARGLDYYTGVIYEAIFKGTTQVGSIAAGGRYDNLVGMFSGGKQVPAVGVSLGIERVFAIMEKQEKDRKSVVRSNQTEVLVVVLGKDEKWTEVAIEIVNDLWEGRLKAEFACVARGKLSQQLTNASTSGIPWVVIAGEDELQNGIVRLRNIAAREQEDVKRENLVGELQRRVGVKMELPNVVQ